MINLYSSVSSWKNQNNKNYHEAKERAMGERLCLRKLNVNQTGIIKSVKAEGELGRRIRDMGLVPNTEVTVVVRAPLKDPVALRLRDFTLSLRNNEADYITVEI
jgi:ferrous iron transport protein A